MTRRLFKTEDGWDVATGWDRMLGHFFLDISRDCPNCDGTGYVGHDKDGEDGEPCDDCASEGEVYAYNNLDDPALIPTMGGMTLRQVTTKLDSLLVEWPQLIIVRLERDQHDNLGNEVSSLGTHGRLKDAATK